MKKTCLFFLVITGLALIASGCFSKRAPVTAAAKESDKKSVEDSDFAAREELTQSFQFAPNATVEVYRVNGSLEVTTTDGNTAEVYVLRLAPNEDTLTRRKAMITFENNTLEIIGERRDRDATLWDEITGEDDLRTRVKLKLPRNINFSTSGISGPVNIGELDGHLEARGISGDLVVAKADGWAELSSINGKVDLTLSNLTRDGINIRGVNGNIELKMMGEVNARLLARGLNGQVTADLPNVKVERQENSRYEATIGNGGPVIEVRNSNGNFALTAVTNTKAADKSADKSKADSAKPAPPEAPKKLKQIL